jgi:hypothetical protein
VRVTGPVVRVRVVGGSGPGPEPGRVGTDQGLGHLVGWVGVGDWVGHCPGLDPVPALGRVAPGQQVGVVVGVGPGGGWVGSLAAWVTGPVVRVRVLVRVGGHGVPLVRPGRVGWVEVPRLVVGCFAGWVGPSVAGQGRVVSAAHPRWVGLVAAGHRVVVGHWVGSVVVGTGHHVGSPTG